MAARDGVRRDRLAWSLAAAGLAGLLAAVWWLGRWPGAGVAVPDPRPAGSSRIPPARPFEPGAFRLEPPVTPPVHHDPLLGAIPAGSRHVVVVEVNALLHAPLGRLWRGCLERYEQELLSALQNGGIDPLVDVDRLALVEGEDGDRRIAAASGFFGRADPAALVRTIASTERAVDVRPYGGDATVFTFDLCIFFECVPMALAVRQDRTLLMGPPASVRGSLDLVQGRSEGEPFAFPGNLGAAEVFGVTDGRELASWLKLDEPALKEWLSALKTRAELRVDAIRDVRASVRVTVEDPAAADDLAGLFGAALAASRSKALAAGDGKRAELLRYVTVSPGRGEFTVALDLPLEALERQFDGCQD